MSERTNATGSDAGTSKEKPRPQFVPTGKLGVQIVLGLALVILVVEAVLMLVIALSIPAEGPDPGKDHHGLPHIEGRDRDYRHGRGGPGEVIGDPEAVPAAAPGELAPLTVSLGSVSRTADDRLRIALDLVCSSGCRLEAARLDIRTSGGSVVEAVEFHGPPGSWSATDTGATVHLAVARGIWIHSVGGWAIDVTLRIPADAGSLPLAVSIHDVRPVGQRAEPASLTIAVPPVQ